MFTEAYNIFILRVWCLSIDSHFALPHVEFEDGYSISVLKNRATRHKKLQLEFEKFLKKSNLFENRLPAVFYTPPFQTRRVHRNLSRLGALVHVRVFKMTGIHSNEKSHGDDSK